MLKHFITFLRFACQFFGFCLSNIKEGYVAESENKLVEYAGKVYDNFAAKPLVAFCIGDKLADIAEKMTFPELLERLEAYLREQTAEA